MSVPSNTQQQIVTIEQVLGPNQYGFYDVVAQGRKHSTKILDIVQVASALVGQMAVITFETVQNQGNDGRLYTNHRLKKVAPFDGPMSPPMVQQPPVGAQPMPTPMQPMGQVAMPPAVSAAPMSQETMRPDHPSKRRSIEKQMSLKLAGDISEFKVEITTVEQFLSLAEAIYAHLQRTWPAEMEFGGSSSGPENPPQDDIPY